MAKVLVGLAVIAFVLGGGSALFFGFRESAARDRPNVNKFLFGAFALLLIVLIVLTIPTGGPT